MGRRYPIVLSWEKATTEEYTGMADDKCDRCGQTLGKDKPFWRRETQVSWFRGDDEVKVLCLSCSPRKPR